MQGLLNAMTLVTMCPRLPNKSDVQQFAIDTDGGAPTGAWIIGGITRTMT